MQFLQSYYFFIAKPKELIALLTAIILIYIYICVRVCVCVCVCVCMYSLYKHEKKTIFTCFLWHFPAFTRSFCFSCLPTKYKTKCNTPFTVSWIMRQTSRSSSTPRASYFVVLLDETQLHIKSWQYGLNQKVWNYYFGCLDKF